MKARVKQYFQEIFALDYRALAFLRIATSLLVLVDLIRRAADLSAHYSNTGVVSRETLLASEFFTYTPSIFLLSGEVWFQGLLFCITGIVAILVLFGYKTKVMSVVLWYLVLSLQTANPLILQRGDSQLLFMLFWGMFLPWEKRFSLDAAYSALPIRSSVATVATAGYILQVAYIYFFAFFHKCQSAVWCSDFTAVQYAFSLDAYSNNLARWFLQFPDFMMLLTLLVLGIQLVALPVILSPIKNAWCKGVMVTLLLCMQIGFLSTLHLGLFPYISIAAILVLYPSSVWSWLGRKLYPTPQVTIYYDTDCGFCRRSVHIIRTFMLHPGTVIKTAQSDPSVLRDMQKHNSWVIVNERGERFFTFAAGVEIVRHSPWRFFLIPFTYLPFITNIGEWTYRKVAQNRSWLPTPKEKEATNVTLLANDPQWKVASALFVVMIIGFITATNVASINDSKLASPINEILKALRLDQNWGVFAPIPSPYDGWYVIQATTTRGQLIDLHNENLPVSYERPDNIAATYQRQRWRKFLNNMYFEEYHFLHEDFLLWKCNQYNSVYQNNRIEHVDLIYFLEFTTATNTLPVSANLLHSVNCL